MGERPKIEPAAEMRTVANALRQMYVALLDEGFTERQALIILGQFLAGSQKSGP